MHRHHVILFLLACSVTTAGYGQTLVLRGAVQVDLLIDPVRSTTATSVSTRLMWKKVIRPSKILVSTSSPGQQFDLVVSAENVKGAVAVGQVILQDGMPATDFIVNAGSKRNGHCALRYTALATATQGVGQDVHVITYTLTEQ